MNSHLANQILALCKDESQCFSDIHLAAGQPTMIRTPAGWVETGAIGPIADSDFAALLKDFRKTIGTEIVDTDVAKELDATVRVRGSLFVTNAGETVALSLRRLPVAPPKLDSLGLPASVDRFASIASGMLLVSGPTGSGKTTTLAAIIDRINETRGAHIITIEDPIEFQFSRRKSIISQRAVGTDTPTFAEGLRSALRQRPDVILIGEIRDRDTAETAFRAAESGHFVMATTHARNTTGAISKFLSFFPGETAVRAQALASCLVGVIAQTLIPRKDSPEGVVASEILHVNSDKVVKAIAANDLAAVEQLLMRNEVPGCTHLNNQLVKMVSKGEIARDAALAASPNPSELAPQINGLGRATD